MEISVLSCIFVLDNQKSVNIKKNDPKLLKVLVNKKDSSLLKINFDKDSDMDDLVRDKIIEITGSKKFHFEQAFSFYEKKYCDDNRIDIVYMALMNIENIKNIDDEYELVSFKILNNNMMTLGNEVLDYSVVSKKINGVVKSYYEVETLDKELEKTAVEILKTYELLKNKISNLEIMSKFMPNLFTLEDVKMVYEMIKNVQVDKSNFRKRIIKYCEKVEGKTDNKGYRPTQIFKFTALKPDIWI